MRSLKTAMRILSDTIVYRVRKGEVLFFVAALTIMVALRLALVDIGFRTIFVFLLNLLAYLNNDYFDLDRDLADGRAPSKTKFLNKHKATALGLQGILLSLLVLLALLHNPNLLVSVFLGFGLCWMYTVVLKEIPLLDIGSIFFWGIGMTLPAIPLTSEPGWKIMVLIGFFSSVFQGIQVIDDYDLDKSIPLTTTAVKFSPQFTVKLVKLLMFTTALYGTLFIHRYLSPLLVIPVFLPVKAGQIKQYWGTVRVIYGLVLLGILAWVWYVGFFTGFPI